MNNDEFDMPLNNRYVEKKRQETKSRMSSVFDEYKELLRDKTHPNNQTPAYDKKLKTTINRLLSAADELDTVNPGEGIFGLIVLSLMSILRVKDRTVELEAENKELKKEINRLKKRK